MATIFQTTFPNAFSRMKVAVPRKVVKFNHSLTRMKRMNFDYEISVKCIPMGLINNIPRIGSDNG